MDRNGRAVFEAPRPTPTGGLLVLMEPKSKATTAAKRIADASGMKVAVSRDFMTRSGAVAEAMTQTDGVYLDALNVAVLRPTAEASVSMLATTLQAETGVRSVRPEFYMFAFSTLEQRYQAWVREGLRILADGAPRALAAPVPEVVEIAEIAGDTENTWGIKAVRANLSPYTGKGIKLCVLDTGLDLQHPDFAGRSITSESFVHGTPVDDHQGHGTHCIGTAAGPFAGDGHPRYGVAPEADIFVGKVLDNRGSGREGWILAGMEWAIENRCEVISMSLGRATQLGEPFDPIYESVGDAALENGCLIIAAAGNESARRFGFIAPVGAPANSPSIMAVAAVDAEMRIADFSSGGLNEDGGEVNIAGPGVDVFSSFPLPQRYRRLQGTSMATPHVAGVAALLAQSDPALRGRALWEALRRGALDVGLPIRDAGAGLVQAPGAVQKA